jgi:hypothetical protein
MQPEAVLHVSTVQGFESEQERFVKTQPVPALQESTVQAFWSLQVMVGKTHPVEGEH